MPSLLQSISSFFSTSSSSSAAAASSSRQYPHIRRDQAMSSIDDAFSVHPDTEYVSSPALYTYPPPAQSPSYDTLSPSSHDHRSPLSAGSSSSKSSRTQPTPLLPLHHTPLSPLPNYPPLQQSWSRLRAWLNIHYPELADTLNWGLPPQDLALLELDLGLTIPAAVRDSYLLVDGQEPESAAGCSEGLFFGLTLLPFEDVLDEWRFWRAVDDDPATGANSALRAAMRSVPPGWIRREYSQRGWLPLVADKAGNYLGVDMSPDERGAVGQVIVFGRDFDTKVVMWNGGGEGGWARWLASFVDELESGEGFEIGGAGDGSEGSEDDVGYESYFFDGSIGKGEGGGEGGRGGLRLTGEYRGWPVLEALADRSMKRWIDAGVMPQPTPIRVTSPDTVELALEPVPELSKTDGPSTPNGDTSALYASQPPSISITKAPAPLPVGLPTEQDLLPSPPYPSPIEEGLAYDQDEEAGPLPMREVHDRTTPVQANFSNSVKEATLVPLPSSDEPSASNSASPVHVQLHRQSSDPSNESQALLADAIRELSPPAVDAASTLTSMMPPSPELESPEAEVPLAGEISVQPTVRLVGGGGGASSLVDDVPNLDKKLASDGDESSGGSAKRKTEAA